MRYPALIYCFSLVLLGCGGKRVGTQTPGKIPRASELVCSYEHLNATDEPSWQSQNVDLNGDGSLDVLLADRLSCDKRNNCHWNVLQKEAHRQCLVFRGVISGGQYEVGDAHGDFGFSDLRMWWQLGDERRLMQVYRVTDGEYRVHRTLTCVPKNEGRDVFECGMVR